MNFVDIVHHELGLFEIIANNLLTNDLINLLIVRKWEPEYKKIIYNKLTKHILEYFKYKKLNIILPWKVDEPTSITNIRNFVEDYEGDVVIKRSIGASLGRFSYNEIPKTTRRRMFWLNLSSFIDIDDIQHSQVGTYVNIDRPHKDKYDVDMECYLGIQGVSEDVPVYWEQKQYLLVSPTIHREMCKRMTRSPISID